jgi:hypothetical protein
VVERFQREKATTSSSSSVVPAANHLSTESHQQKINSIEEPSKTKAKSLVKPQTHPTPSIQTTYPWHLSYLKAVILKIVEKTNQKPLRNLPSGALLI